MIEALKRHRWTEKTLEQKRKGDPVKLKIARQLREQTTMTKEWIADRLEMGTKTYLAHLLYWSDRNNK